MKAVAAVAAIAALLLAGLLFGGPLPVAAAQVPQQAPVSTAPLQLVLDDMTPRVVTSDGPSTLTVSGTLTNNGTEPFDQLVVRVQRGGPMSAEGDLRDALDGNAGADAVTPQFLPLADRIAPGEQVPVRLTLPLRGAPDTGLALSQTGVHELLVNVNGVPQGGTRARLAAVRMLLPVVSLPPLSADTKPKPVKPAGAPTPFALLYPIADTPRRLSTVTPEPTVMLTDDELAASLAPTGRLGGLVAAFAEKAPLGSKVRDSTCLAVDADLVETVAAMRAGYMFRGSDGIPVPGTGAEVAKRWLDQLVSAARGGCVIALPYADADIVALTRGGMASEATAAATDGRDVLADVLQTSVAPGLTWPVDGAVDGPTLAAIADADATSGGTSLVLSADSVAQGRSRRTGGVVQLAGERQNQVAALADPLLSLAASGPDAKADSDAGRGGAAPASTPAGIATPLSTQDAIGALTFRIQAGARDTANSPLLLAPPHQWAAEGTGARALLDAVGQLITAGGLEPRRIDEVLAAGPPATPPTAAREIAYPLRAAGREVQAGVVDSIRTAAGDLADLRSTVVELPDSGINPDDVFTPLRRGLVRPVSAAWRGRPVAAGVSAGAGLARIDDIRNTVRVIDPPSPYSLGTSDAPLPLTVANGLPVAVKVRVEVASTAGLRVAPIEPVIIPPLGRRQVSADAKVTRSGQFTVDVAVRTPEGKQLGPPSRVRVHSTAYGTITLWLMAIAGVLLVVLAARRVLRRIRGEPSRPEVTGQVPATAPIRPHMGPANGRAQEINAQKVPAREDLAPTVRLPAAGPPHPPRRPPEQGPPRVPTRRP